MSGALTAIEKRDLAAHIKALIDDTQAEAGRAAQQSLPVQLDQQSVGRVSRIDAIQQQQMALARSAQLKQSLQRLQTALQALQADDSDFGVCEQCDQPIPLGRLKINPAVTRCVRCAE